MEMAPHPSQDTLKLGFVSDRLIAEYCPFLEPLRDLPDCVRTTMQAHPFTIRWPCRRFCPASARKCSRRVSP